MERHITNQLRLADEQTLATIETALDNPSELLDQREASIDVQVQLLLTSPAALQEFVERSSIEDHANIQRLRQLTRNARRAQGSARTAPGDALRELVAQLMFAED